MENLPVFVIDVQDITSLMEELSGVSQDGIQTLELTARPQRPWRRVKEIKVQLLIEKNLEKDHLKNEKIMALKERVILLESYRWFLFFHGLRWPKKDPLCENVILIDY